MRLLFLFSEVGAGFQIFLAAWQDRAATEAYALALGNGTVFTDRGSVDRDSLVAEVRSDAGLFGRLLFLFQGVLLLSHALARTDDLIIKVAWENGTESEAEA